MFSQMHQMMSQENQVVKTTPGQSQRLCKTSETVKLTEIIENSQQGHNRQHNVGNNSFLGSLLVLPVEL